MEKIYSTVGIRFPKTKGNMLKNERYSFQIAFLSRWTGMEECKIKVTSELSERISWRVVEYANGKYTLPDNHDDYYIFNKNVFTTFPDILKPFGKTDLFLRANLWTSVWFTVDGATHEGAYDIRIELFDKENNPMCECQYKLEVLNAMLPPCDIPVLQRLNLECICDYHRITPFSDAFAEVFNKYLKSYVLHGNNALNISLFSNKMKAVIVSKINSAYVFNLDNLQNLVFLAKKAGITYFAFCVRGGEDFMSDFSPVLHAFLAENDILQNSFIYVNEKELVSANGERSVSVLPIHQFEAKIREIEEGNSVWISYDQTESYGHYTNRFLNCSLQRLRVLGFQMYLSKAQGFSHWAFNYYYDKTGKQLLNPHQDTDGLGGWPSGEAFLVYPSYPNEKAEIYDSVRLEAFANAIEDYRAMRLLEKCRGREFAVKYLEKKGFYGFSVYPSDLDEHLWIREEINTLIQGELQE